MPGDAANSVSFPPGIAGVIGPVPTTRITQTFYIDTPQPNVLFAAAVPSQVYFPAGGLQVDRYGSIRSPILLDEGMVYSVVSEVPVTVPSDPALGAPRARSCSGCRTTCSFRRPSRERRRSGRRITAGETTEYDRVEAVQAWLRANTEVQPRRPEGSARRRRGGPLPVRDADGVLRADRDVARGHAADARDPDAAGDGLRTR